MGITKYIENNKKISELLNENEQILIIEGYNPPINNISVKMEERIKFPPGYIRTADEFIQSYCLNDLVKDKHIRKNIAYALQLSDYYNFILNRFNVWGSIEVMLYKQAFINIISIMEALILESVSRINDNCKQCKKIDKCENNINKFDRGNMKYAVEKLYGIGILKISENEKKRMIELYDLRNKIHIRLNEINEFMDDKFNNDLYNEGIKLLKKTDSVLVENAIQYYDKCVGYKAK